MHFLMREQNWFIIRLGRFWDIDAMKSSISCLTSAFCKATWVGFMNFLVHVASQKEVQRVRSGERGGQMKSDLFEINFPWKRVSNQSMAMDGLDPWPWPWPIQVCSKLSKSAGILYKLKYFFPIEALKYIYISFIVLYIYYISTLYLLFRW